MRRRACVPPKRAVEGAVLRQSRLPTGAEGAATVRLNDVKGRIIDMHALRNGLAVAVTLVGALTARLAGCSKRLLFRYI